MNIYLRNLRNSVEKYLAFSNSVGSYEIINIFLELCITNTQTILPEVNHLDIDLSNLFHCSFIVVTYCLL
jgi:hypothetical protein